MMRIKTSLISLSIFLLFILPAAFADYSDVLLVANSNSPVSLKIADYFQANRPNLTHRLNISTPEAECNNFSTVNATMLQPIKAYLNSTNDTINYIVLTKGFPLYTCGDVLDYFGANWSLKANASSVD